MASAIRTIYFGEKIYRQYVNTRQSIIPNMSLIRPPITGIVLIDNKKTILVINRFISNGAFLSTSR